MAEQLDWDLDGSQFGHKLEELIRYWDAPDAAILQGWLAEREPITFRDYINMWLQVN